MERQNQYKYFAFISYRGADVEIAKKLQKKFNNFKLPSSYINPFDETNHRMQPVCRDRDNFVGGELSAQIKDAIDHSMYVVMVCTPNMTRNEDQTNYVNDEIQHLIDTGRLNRLIPLVFGGTIYSTEDYVKAGRGIDEPFPDECLPYALRTWMADHASHDFALNIFNIEEQGERDEEKMFLRCVATILAEEFTKLWDRFKVERKKREKMLLASAFAAICVVAAVVFGAVSLTQPVDVRLKMKELSTHNDRLPDLKDAIIRLSVDDYMNTDTIAGLNDWAILDKVPYSYLGEDVHITFRCRNWFPLDTVVRLTKELEIGITRDPDAYGDIQFRLWDEDAGNGCPNVNVSINGHEVISDGEGRVRYNMPLSEQDIVYSIESEIPLEDKILYMPVTESTVIIVK